jgi:HPt (histidine-containing phosphotransfer) domain-containing protein
MDRTAMASAATTPNEPIPAVAVDEQVLATLVDEIGDGDSSILEDLIDSYLDEATQQVAQLEAAAESGDAATVASIAHSLKSASGALGVTRLAGLLQQAEASAKQTASNLSELVVPVHDEFTRATEALMRLRPTG